MGEQTVVVFFARTKKGQGLLKRVGDALGVATTIEAPNRGVFAFDGEVPDASERVIAALEAEEGPDWDQHVLPAE